MITPRKPDPDKTILDSAETCWLLGITYKTLVEWIESRGLPSKNLGTAKRAHYLFFKPDIEQWSRDQNKIIADAMAEEFLVKMG